MKQTTRKFSSASPLNEKNIGAASQKFIIYLIIAAAVLGQLRFVTQKDTAEQGMAEEGVMTGKNLSNGDEFIPRQFNVFEDFADKTFTNILALMKRDDGRTAIEVAKIDMTAFLTDAFKTKRMKHAYNMDGFKRGNPGHQLTSTSCKPTNFKGKTLRCSTSKQSCIASLTRFINVDNVLACVWQPFKAGTVATNTSSSSFSINTKNCFLDINSPLLLKIIA